MSEESNGPVVETAANRLDAFVDDAPPTPGLTQAPGLREVPDSKVPRTDRSHVHGPQQSACDPAAAGLDVDHHPMTRAENRAVTLTGKDGSGPHAYEVASSESHETVAALPDHQQAIGEVEKGA